MIFAPLLLIVIVVVVLSAASRTWASGPQASVAPPRRTARRPLPPAPRPRLPLAAQAEVERIRRKAALLLRHRERFPLGSENLYMVERIERDYLPATLDGYRALGGHDEPLAADGRTGLEVLHDQLGLLEGKLDEVAAELRREDGDRLLANGRFLRQRLGR